MQFHLDQHSGLPMYLQIVGQVKEALRLGPALCRDQLPTVREVVADLAYNPNTVAKPTASSSTKALWTPARDGAHSSRGHSSPRRSRLTSRCGTRFSNGSRKRSAPGIDAESIRALVSRTLREALDRRVA